MKNIAVISFGLRTSLAICDQLKKLFGEAIEIKGYAINDDYKREMNENTLVVITSHHVAEYVIRALGEAFEYVVTKRVINYQHLEELIKLEAGTEVLLVNDHMATAYLTIEQLKKHGIDHVKYYPYYPGMSEVKKIEVAVTPNERHLVPEHIHKVIDLGTRHIDITSLIEIANRLGVLDKKVDILSSQYVSDMVLLLKKFDKTAQEANELKNMLQAILDNSQNGILYYDRNGVISGSNDVVSHILGKDRLHILNSHVEDILPNIDGFAGRETFKDILTLNEVEYMVSKLPVRKDKKIIGYLVSFENTKDIVENEHNLRRKARQSKHQAIYSFENIIGQSEVLQKSIKLSKKLALSKSTVLLEGESGTGKEFFAQAIHNYSKRYNSPFVAVNFAALTMNLLESELFGYEEGAFTGAKKGGKPGLFEQAHTGTIFLDEIGDASLDLQARLLRVLQEKEVRRVGGVKVIPVDVRVIAATNKDLFAEVEKGTFRRDLFYRLNILPLSIPSLRERHEDIAILLEFYLGSFTNKSIKIDEFFSEGASGFLMRYKWPGNIRELVNVVEYLINVKEPNTLIEIDDLPAYVFRDNFDDGVNLRLVAAKNREMGYTLIDAELSQKDKDMLWVLKKIYQAGGSGRRKLSQMAKDEGVSLSEGKVRTILGQLEELGLIKSTVGAGGTIITQKGIELIMGE